MEVKDLTLRIAYFRNRNDLSARELSLLIGKHGGYINKLESKDFNLPTSVLLKNLETLNVSCEEFFAENFMTYKTDKELASTFEKLSADNKKMILELMKNLK